MFIEDSKRQDLCGSWVFSVKMAMWIFLVSKDDQFRNNAIIQRLCLTNVCAYQVDGKNFEIIRRDANFSSFLVSCCLKRIER